MFIDTNIAIGLIHKQFSIEKFQALLEPNEKLAITAITLYELYYGLFYMEFNKKGKKSSQSIQVERIAIDHLKNSLSIIDLNEQAAYKSAEIYHRLSSQGKKIEELDCLIAGIILSSGSTKIITDNKDHFERINEIQTLSLSVYENEKKE